MSEYEQISLEMRGHVAVLTIDNPPYNFVNLGMLGEMVQALQALDNDPDCRVLLLASAGKAFCAGADFKSELAADTDLNKATSDFYSLAMQLFDFGKPIVAAVSGAAVGAGFGLALLADFRIASPESTFSANFNRLGIHPGFGMSVTLPRAVGVANAELLFYTGRRIKGETAKALGLLTELVAESEIFSTALALAEEVSLSAPLAVQHTRATLRRGLAEQVRAANRNEQETQAQEMLTADFREGVQAAAERRLPNFTGA